MVAVATGNSLDTAGLVSPQSLVTGVKATAPQGVSEPAQLASFFERLNQLDKCLEESLNPKITQLQLGPRTMSTAWVYLPKKNGGPDPPDFWEQEELDQEELGYLQYDLLMEELGADGE